MSVLIGHASISEKGTINGASGDQTGKEVCTRSWYKKPWNVMLICTDKALAARAAQEMRYACANNNIGYGQNDRRTAYDSAVKNGRTFKNAKGNTDCSQLVAGCYILAGLSGLSADCYTGNLRQALLNTGKFKAYTDSAHLNSDVYAEVGAIYLKEGSHVVMALENGSKAGESAVSSGGTGGGSTAYKVGSIYTLQSNMVVRTGPGKNYRAKTHAELTADGRKHDKDKNGCLDKGTRVTCKAVKTVGNQVWIQAPSGWMCARDGARVYIA